MTIRSPPAPATCCPTRCASCARSRSGCDGASSGAGLRRGLHAGAGVRGGAAPAATSARPARGYRLFDEHGRGAGAALGHDDPDRAPGGAPATPSASCRCASATSPTPTACRRRAAVGEPREFLQGGLELIGSAGAARARPRWSRWSSPRSTRRACAATASGVGDGSLYRRAARRRWRSTEDEHAAAARVRSSRRDLVGLERAGRVSLGLGGAERELLAAPARAARRPRGARARAGRASVRGRRGPARLLRAAGRARRGRPRDLRPRPRARARLLHGRGVRGLRPGRGLRARRRRPLRRPARALRPRRCPPAASRSTCSACTWPRPPRRRSDERADDRRAARRAVRGDARPARRLGIDTAEVRANDRKLVFAERRHRDDAPERRAHLRGARRRPTSASPARTCCSSSPSANVYELLDLGFGALPHGRRGARGRRPDRVGAAAAGPGPDRDQVPAHRRAQHFAGTGRQAEIVEVKGSVELAPLTGLVDGIVDLTATGTTLAENGLVWCEEICGLHRAPDRQPGGAQAEGGRDRRAGGGSGAGA